MRRTRDLLILAFCSLALAPRISAQVEIPTAAQGYTVSMTSASEDAPSGYMGRTEKATQTVVGREPDVIGRQYITHFTLANKVRTCPKADGTAEGDGELTVSGDYTRTQPSGTSTSHFAASAKAKYKGKVGDDGFLDGPVTADIDFTYVVTAGAGSAHIDPTAPAPIFVSQHITTQFIVGKKLFDGPTISAFAGGDPTQGHFGTATGMSLALTYWAGIWYGFAETQWQTPNKCVEVVFDPPSNSRQPVLGSNVKVNAYINTKGGEGVRGTFVEVNPHNPTSETVASSGGNTDPGSPAIFTYTAPNTKVNKPGFYVAATSRAGAATANWDTGLGTNWSGQITASKISADNARNSDLQTAYHHEATRINIRVKDGIATVDGFSEIHGAQENRHHVAANGTSHLEFDNGGTDEATAQGEVKGTVSISLSPDSTHYSIFASYGAFTPGTRNTTSCLRDKCTSSSQPFSVAAILAPMGGKIDDLNHVHGSMDLGKGPAGFGPVGGSYTITWDLARQGTTK